MTDQLVSAEENNTQYNIIRVFKLLFILHKNNYVDDTMTHIKLLSQLGTIFKSEATAKTFVFFIQNGASTAWVIQTRLGISVARTYSVLRDLTALGLVEQIRKVQRVEFVRGGPKPKVYGLLGCTKNEVVAAINLHNRSKSPKYLHAEDVAQSILEKYLIPRRLTEISHRDLMMQIRACEKPYHQRDIYDITSKILRGNGIKVWD